MQLKTNFFTVDFDDEVVAYHYDLTFTPDVPSKFKSGKLFNDALKKGVFGGVPYVIFWNSQTLT